MLENTNNGLKSLSDKILKLEARVTDLDERMRTLDAKLDQLVADVSKIGGQVVDDQIKLNELSLVVTNIIEG